MLMPQYLAALTLILLIGMVIVRVLLMRRAGVQAMQFGKIDRTDFLIPPFALFYFYLVFAAAFGLPTVIHHELFDSEVIAWIGVLFCAAGLLLFLFSMISFGESFRVGIDTGSADELITTGAFARSRNPIYVAVGLVLLGQFLIFPNWIFLIYLGAAIWLFHRQVLHEEEFLTVHYGQTYAEYCRRVRRYA